VLPNSARSVRTNGRDAMLSLVKAGVGIACLARVVGDELPGLERVPLTPPPPAPTLWLGMPRDLRSTPRVRTVADLIVEKLGARLREAH
jgi:DNA-binding transcriptional LysR family regulator